MKLNKKHDIWKQAPWYVRISVLGVPSLKALNIYANISFFAGLTCWFALFMVLLGNSDGPIAFLGLGSGFGLAGCMYFYAIVWVLSNPESLE